MTNQRTVAVDLPWETAPSPRRDDPGILDRLRTLDSACSSGVNVNERISVLIRACIGEGLVAEGQIISVLMALHYNNRQVGAILNGATGLWRKGRDHTFSLVERESDAPKPASVAHIQVPAKKIKLS